MAKINTTTKQSKKEVLDEAVNFFTDNDWTVLSQGERSAVFQTQAPYPYGKLILGIGFVLLGIPLTFIVIGIPLIIIGIILLYKVRYRAFTGGNVNLTVKVSPLDESDLLGVVVSYPKEYRKVANNFIDSLST